MATNAPGVSGTRAAGIRANRASGFATSTETKPAFKTTEFVAYLVVAVAVAIAGAVADGFGAQDVWLYVSILTVGYMVSRGLAKSGSYEREVDHDRT